MQRRLSDFIKDWAFPTVVLLVAATGAWVRFEMGLSEHTKRIDALELKIDRSFECGSDGFLSPASHSAHDLHVIHFFTRELGIKGWRRFVNEYANGTE